jgi:hypothetical protein
MFGAIQHARAGEPDTLSQAATHRKNAKFHVLVWQFLSLQSCLSAHQMLDVHIDNDRAQPMTGDC